MVGKAIVILSLSPKQTKNTVASNVLSDTIPKFELSYDASLINSYTLN